jgi:phenylacetate-CoA ligase
VVVEIVRPGTGDPVPEGEVGEVLVTTFDRTTR